ncbi:hypothetical protein AMR42_01690 [Limnothrix sp. PR1529]|nr:hypothetical protein BCR12_00565 [Limnothrix sp. P13C2]PIB15246.1 hypothetical protein AMR42_01690 [Limnothrix sp. PR1529]
MLCWQAWLDRLLFFGVGTVWSDQSGEVRTEITQIMVVDDSCQPRTGQSSRLRFQTALVCRVELKMKFIHVLLDKTKILLIF